MNKVILLLLLWSNVMATEMPPRIHAAIPNKEDPLFIVSLRWSDGSKLAHYKDLAKSNVDTPEVTWAKSQVAIDSGDLESFVSCYEAVSQDDLRKKMTGDRMSRKAKEREGLDIKVSGTAYVDDLAAIAYVMKTANIGPFPWVDQVVGPDHWRIRSTDPINSPLNIALSAWSSTKGASNESVELPKSGFAWGTLSHRSEFRSCPDVVAASETKSLIIGVNVSSILKTPINVQSYNGDDPVLVLIKAAAEAVREDSETATVKYFEFFRPPTNKNHFHWADKEPGTRQTIVYLRHESAPFVYLGIGDVEGVKAFCVVTKVGEQQKITFKPSKSLSPFILSAKFSADCVEKLRNGTGL